MGVRVEAQPCWTITCDTCGEGDNAEYGGHFHYGSESEAKQAVRDADWRENADGTLICDACIDNAKEAMHDAIVGWAWVCPGCGWGNPDVPACRSCGRPKP